MDTKGKVVTSIGVGIGVIAAWWLLRGRGAPSLGSEMGAPDPSRVYLAAVSQVKKALAGTPLDDYRQAENLSLFWATAENDALAYLKTGYWLAVASRLAKDGSLARAAEANMVKAGKTRSGQKSNITAIFTDASKLVAKVAAGNKALGAVVKVLATQADPGMIASWQQSVYDQSTTGIIKGTIAKSAEDVSTAAHTIRGIFTGEKPPGMSDFTWFMWKWGLRVGIMGSVGIGLWLTFGSKGKALAAAAKSVVAKARAGALAAKAALTDTREAE